MSRRRVVTVAAVAALFAAEAVACGLFGAPGERLRLWVNLLSVQGIVLALAGSFLLVDRPFAAARAVRRGGAPDAEETPGDRRRWGLGLLSFGALLFGGAALIWFVVVGG